jgi:hypothetical protein
VSGNPGNAAYPPIDVKTHESHAEFAEGRFSHYSSRYSKESKSAGKRRPAQILRTKLR